MNTPSVPSSSLYRFKSILGVIIITLSVCCGAYFISTYIHRSNLVHPQIDLINKEIDNFSIDLEKIKSQAIPICELNNCKCIDDKGELVSPVFLKGPPLINKRKKELMELYSRYEQVEKKLNSKKSGVDLKMKMLDAYLAQTNWFILISVSILITGIVLVFTGFRDWRNKIQLYQDSILKAHARKLNSDL
jgi:hypothetical protein